MGLHIWAEEKGAVCAQPTRSCSSAPGTLDSSPATHTTHARPPSKGSASDNYSESLWRLAMQPEGSLGLRDSVSERYQQLRSLLDDQLGLEPERSTRALYHELRAAVRDPQGDEAPLRRHLTRVGGRRRVSRPKRWRRPDVLRSKRNSAGCAQGCPGSHHTSWLTLGLIS